MEILDALREPGPDAVMPPSPLGVKHIPIGTRIRFANEVGEPAAKWLLGTIASVRGATQPFVYSVEVEDKVKGGTCIRELSLGEKGWSFDDPRDRRRYEILRATADGMTAMQDALAATGWNLVVSQGVATRSNKGDTDNEQAAGVQENEKSPKTVLPSVEGEGASPPVVDSAVAELQPPSAKMPVPVANGAEVSVVRKRGRPPKAKGDVATPDSTAQKGRGFPGEDAARTSLRAGAARGAQVPAVGATAAARGHAMNGNAGASAHGATPAASYSELPNLQLLLRPQAAIALVQQIKEYRECSGDRLSPDRLKEIDKKMKTLMQWSQTATDDDGISEAWNSAVLILHRMRELAGCQNVDNAKILQAFPMTPEGIGRVREYLKWLEVRLLHWVAYFTQGRPLSQEQGEKIVKIQESFEGSESDIRSEMQALIRERKLCMEHLQAENNSWMATCPMIARLLMLSHALLDPEETEQAESEEVREKAVRPAKQRPEGGKSGQGTAASSQARKAGSSVKRRESGAGSREREDWVKRKQFRRLKVPEAVPAKRKKGRPTEAAPPAMQTKGKGAVATPKSNGKRKKAMTGSRMCHQCNRVDKPTIFHCQTCKRYRYCGGCIRNRYQELTEQDVERKCPKCRDICNCGHCRDSKNQPRLPPARLGNKKVVKRARRKENSVENVSTDSGASGPSQSTSLDMRA